MFGRTTTLGDDPNDFEWSVPASDAARFESLIFRAVHERLATRDASVQVAPTARSGDEGRDIEISFRVPVRIGPRVFSPPQDREVARIFIECKATKHPRVDDSFLVDATQHEHGQLSAYVLATNGSLSPYSHFRAEREWRSLGAEFILMDRRRLFDWLFTSSRFSVATRELLPSEPPQAKPSDLVVQVQTRHERLRGEHRVQTYAVVRNNSDIPQHVVLASASDLSWDSDIDLEAILGPGEDRTYRFASRQRLHGLSSDLRLSVTREGRSHRLDVAGPRHDLVLEAPFYGEAHHAVRDKLRESVESARGLRIISIEGEAGVGKSRCIDEALTPLEGSLAMTVRLHCAPSSGDIDLSPLLDLLDEIAPGRSQEPISTPSLFDAVERASSCPVPLVIVCEDLHHLSEEGVRALKKLVLDPPRVPEAIVLVVTGRNDHTFPNPDYYAFLELVRMQSEVVDRIRLSPLNGLEARNLIRAVAADLPEIAVAHVQEVGQNNPFIILELLQYLLDVGLASLLSRQAIGVADPERFVGIDGLPASVEMLYQMRLEALAGADGGTLASDLLCFAALCGPRVRSDVVDRFLDGEDSQAVLSLLVVRRFLTPHPENGEIEFTHENLFHAAKAWVTGRGDAKAGATRILGLAASEYLPAFDRATLHHCAGSEDAAFSDLKPIWTRVQAVTNFSSEEIDRAYFRHLPTLFAVSRARNEPPEALGRLAVTSGYMGVHNFPLFQGEQACHQAIRWLEDVYPEAPDGREWKLALAQLRAHALQNMGRSSESLRIMLELQSEISLGGGAPAPVRYDLFDRLQEHYRRVNHAKLMIDYGRLAAQAVVESEDEKLMSSHLITQSLTQLYRGRKAALAAATKARQSAARVGIRRFEVFNASTALIARTLYADGRMDELRDVFDEARALLRTAATESFSDSIVRLELLLGTVALQVYDDHAEGRRRAREFVQAGREAAVRFGIGLYDWALENLWAVSLIEEVSEDDESIFRSFSASLDRLRRRGLLFVGASDGTFPNVHAISNIVRHRALFSEREASRLLHTQVSAYDGFRGGDGQRVLSMVLDAASGNAIFWPERGLKMLRYPRESGYFTPLF